MSDEQIKPVNYYALNDIVWSKDWETASSEVYFSVRFTGLLPDGSICFRVRRQLHVKTGGGGGFLNLPTLTVPKAPETWDVRLPLNEQGIATAVWRIGPGETDVELQHYTLTKNNVLVHVQVPDIVPETQESRRIGFRAGSEERH
jgi:hypothetical protein